MFLVLSQLTVHAFAVLLQYHVRFVVLRSFVLHVQIRLDDV